MHLALQVEMRFPINTVGNKCEHTCCSQFGAVRKDGIDGSTLNKHSTMWNVSVNRIFTVRKSRPPSDQA